MEVAVNDVQMWREPRVLEVSGLGRSTMRAYVAAGKFPAPVKIGERASAWISTEILDWIKQRVEQHRRVG